MSGRVTVLGAPSSAGAHFGGQELAPAAIRRAGFIDRLAGAGLDVVDAGDVDGEVFRVDPEHDRTRNIDAVVGVAERVADAVQEHVGRGYLPIVIGGDCTISLGVVAGLQRVRDDVGVAYIDGDADLSTPDRTHSGILDATGVAHLLGFADTPLATIGTAHPMLQPDQLVLLGYDPTDLDTYDADVFAPPGTPPLHRRRDPSGCRRLRRAREKPSRRQDRGTGALRRRLRGLGRPAPRQLPALRRRGLAGDGSGRALHDGRHPEPRGHQPHRGEPDARSGRGTARSLCELCGDRDRRRHPSLS